MLNNKPKILLCFDFGMRHIGVAVGQVITKSATELNVLTAVDGVPNWNQVKDLIDTWQVDAFVIGLPLNMDGTEQPLTTTVKRFARKLHGRFNLPVFLQDERLSTKEAQRLQKNTPAKKAATNRADSLAAKIILESWLRENA